MILVVTHRWLKSPFLYAHLKWNFHTSVSPSIPPFSPIPPPPSTLHCWAGLSGSATGWAATAGPGRGQAPLSCIVWSMLVFCVPHVTEETRGALGVSLELRGQPEVRIERPAQQLRRDGPHLFPGPQKKTQKKEGRKGGGEMTAVQIARKTPFP